MPESRANEHEGGLANWEISDIPGCSKDLQVESLHGIYFSGSESNAP